MTPRSAGSAKLSNQCRRKFLGFFPGGFRDETYLAWERGYKWNAHMQWRATLERQTFDALLSQRQYQEIAQRVLRIEARTNLLFSFEKMALRDAVRSQEGARSFAEGLHKFLHGEGGAHEKFDEWVETVASLPRKQTRVLTWPIVTVMGFLAAPRTHIFLKPNVTRAAARSYGYEFDYGSRPNWRTYASLLKFARLIAADQRDLRPRDLIDIQSFIWVQGSSEYD